jgi:hypothetical protein
VCRLGGAPPENARTERLAALSRFMGAQSRRPIDPQTATRRNIADPEVSISCRALMDDGSMDAMLLS